MSRLTDAQLDLLARYLDEALSPAERERFESELSSSPHLRAEVEAQRRLDSSLTRLFEDSDVSAEAGGPVPAPGPIRLWWIGSVAAGVLLALGLVYYLTRPNNSDLASPQLVWTKMQERQFQPAWKCKDDQDFIKTVRTRLGEGLLVPAETKGLEVAGWVYCGTYFPTPLSDSTMILIAKKDNDDILLMVDRKSADRRLSVPESSGLHLFRDTEGGLVLYELSPRSEPAVIPVAKASEGRVGAP